MTRTLILIRHGKSGWDGAQGDHARTLTDRGRRDASAMGAWLRSEGHVPDVVLCSSAARTRGTEAALDLGPDARVLDDLYQAKPERILGLLSAETAPILAVIAHNPGIGDLARRLAAASPDNERFASYPTCATTILTFETDDWSQASEGRVVAFRTPHDLK